MKICTTINLPLKVLKENFASLGEQDYRKLDFEVTYFQWKFPIKKIGSKKWLRDNFKTSVSIWHSDVILYLADSCCSYSFFLLLLSIFRYLLFLVDLALNSDFNLVAETTYIHQIPRRCNYPLWCNFWAFTWYFKWKYKKIWTTLHNT